MTVCRWYYAVRTGAQIQIKHGGNALAVSARFWKQFSYLPIKRKKKCRKTSPVMSCPSPPREWKEPGLSPRGASHTLAPAYCMLSWCADDNAIMRISVSRWEPSGCCCLAPIAFTLCLKLKKQSTATERMSQIFLTFFFFGGNFDVRRNLVTLTQTGLTAESSVFTVLTGFNGKYTQCPLQTPC